MVLVRIFQAEFQLVYSCLLLSQNQHIGICNIIHPGTFSVNSWVWSGIGIRENEMVGNYINEAGRAPRAGGCLPRPVLGPRYDLSSTSSKLKVSPEACPSLPMSKRGVAIASCDFVRGGPCSQHNISLAEGHIIRHQS